MESHKGILQCVIKFAFDFALKHILWYGIINIKQGNRILTNHRTDKLTECSIDIYFTRYWNSLLRKAAVHITWNETKLRLECWPAFTSNCNIFTISSVFRNPIF